MLANRLRSQRLTALAGLGAVVYLLLAPSAQAQSPGQTFQDAREAYTRGAYEEVVRLLGPMVGDAVPSDDVADDRILVRESRKYLGAAYVLTGQRADAEVQFEALLRAEGDELESYHLDPVAFPSSVHTVFDAVRERLVQAVRDDQADRARQNRLRRERRRQSLLRLVALAQEDTVEAQNSELLAWLPFGIGQFQNENNGLGYFFALSESLLLTTAAASFAGWLTVEEQHARSLVPAFATPPVDPALYFGLLGLNWASFGAAAILIVAGIIESVSGYRPTRTIRRTRELPPDLLENLELLVSPTGAGTRLRF